MNPANIKWTDKMRAVLSDNSQIIYLTGATGCSKTLIAGIKFINIMNESPPESRAFFIIGRNAPALVRNLLESKGSFYNTFRFLFSQYTSHKDGGLQFDFYSKTGTKKVYIIGADNKNSWTAALGSEPDGLWLEELSVLDIDCIRECMGRAKSRRCKLLATTNGGMPTDLFYSEFVNHAIPQFKDTIPAVELQDMVADREYAHYYHFNIIDDTPYMSKEERQELLELYPPNSFYYKSKILGVRGAIEGAAFAELMNRQIHLREHNDINFNAVKELVCAVDIGGSTDIGNQKRSATVVTLVAFSRGYQRALVIERWAIPATSYDDIIATAETHLMPYYARYIEKFKTITIDSAADILIRTWDAKNRLKGVNIKGSIKGVGKEVTLVTRADLKKQLLMQERLLWSTNAEESYNAHTRLISNEDGSVKDLSTQNNDDNDALDYALTERWNWITAAQARRR